MTAFGTHACRFAASSNRVHNFQLTDLSSDYGWTLFSNPSLMNPGFLWMKDFCDDNTGEIEDIPSLTAGTTYYLAIDEWDYIAGTYDLLIASP